MGQLFLQDWLMGHKSVEEFDLFDVSDIEKAFEMIEYVKFGQVVGEFRHSNTWTSSDKPQRR